MPSSNTIWVFQLPVKFRSEPAGYTAPGGMEAQYAVKRPESTTG
jgi:hypothetical protein